LGFERNGESKNYREENGEIKGSTSGDLVEKAMPVWKKYKCG